MIVCLFVFLLTFVGYSNNIFRNILLIFCQIYLMLIIWWPQIIISTFKTLIFPPKDVCIAHNQHSWLKCQQATGISQSELRSGRLGDLSCCWVRTRSAALKCSAAPSCLGTKSSPVWSGLNIFGSCSLSQRQKGSIVKNSPVWDH